MYQGFEPRVFDFKDLVFANFSLLTIQVSLFQRILKTCHKTSIAEITCKFDGPCIICLIMSTNNGALHLNWLQTHRKWVSRSTGSRWNGGSSSPSWSSENPDSENRRSSTRSSYQVSQIWNQFNKSFTNLYLHLFGIPSLAWQHKSYLRHSVRSCFFNAGQNNGSGRRKVG